MSPVDDTFISGSLDKTIRLWDLRSPNCQASPRSRVSQCVNYHGRCCGSMTYGVGSDVALCVPPRAWCTCRGSRCAPSIQRVSSSPLGLTLRWWSCTTCGPSTRWEVREACTQVMYANGVKRDNKVQACIVHFVHFTDQSSLSQGPFATFKLQYDRTCEWTGLKFSNDGKLILLSTNGGAVRLLDAFKGAVLHSFGVRSRSSSWTLSIRAGRCRTSCYLISNMY